MRKNGESNLNLISFVEDEHLKKLDVRLPFPRYISSLWSRRHFIGADVRAKAFSDNRDLRMGVLWSLIQPLLDALSYGIIFGVLLNTSRGIDNFVGFLIIGLAFFGYLQKGLSSGKTLVRSQRNIIRSFKFPRVAIILSFGIRGLLDSIPSAVMTIVIALCLQWREPLSWTILLCIPLFLMIHIFATGILFISSRICAFIPEARVLIDFIARAWFISSGVFFSIDRFASNEIVYKIFQMNPGHLFLDAIRNAAIYSTAPTLSGWMTLLAWTFGTFFAGLLFFWQAEERYVRV